MKNCNQCGKCCIRFGGGLGTATDVDIELWKEKRPYIIDYVYSLSLPDMWLNPITGREMNRCPWLKKLSSSNSYTCLIHGLKPEICFSYPLTVKQMFFIDCEMLEPDDYLKDHILLQHELDVLMGRAGIREVS